MYPLVVLNVPPPHCTKCKWRALGPRGQGVILRRRTGLPPRLPRFLTRACFELELQTFVASRESFCRLLLLPLREKRPKVCSTSNFVLFGIYLYCTEM